MRIESVQATKWLVGKKSQNRQAKSMVYDDLGWPRMTYDDLRWWESVQAAKFNGLRWWESEQVAKIDDLQWRKKARTGSQKSTVYNDESQNRRREGGSTMMRVSTSNEKEGLQCWNLSREVTSSEKKLEQSTKINDQQWRKRSIKFLFFSFLFLIFFLYILAYLIESIS